MNRGLLTHDSGMENRETGHVPNFRNGSVRTDFKFSTAPRPLNHSLSFLCVASKCISVVRNYNFDKGLSFQKTNTRQQEERETFKTRNNAINT